MESVIVREQREIWLANANSHPFIPGTRDSHGVVDTTSLSKRDPNGTSTLESSTTNAYRIISTVTYDNIFRHTICSRDGDPAKFAGINGSIGIAFNKWHYSKGQQNKDCYPYQMQYHKDH